MSNEPKAGQGLDPELLAAYVDHRLSPEQRAEVEARLATDPDAYELLVETMRAQDALRAAPVVVPFAAQTGSSRTRRWVIAGGVLAAAAAIILAVWIPRRGAPDGGNAVEPRLQKLVAAVGNERYIEARVTGGFEYGPLRSATRSGATANLSVVAAAGELQAAANANPNAENLRVWGGAALHVGQWDEAVRALEQGASLDPADARLQANLSAAYLARAQQLDRAADLPKGLAAAERALKLDDGLLEARFNRALALELLHLPGEAKKAWEDYAARDSSEWGEVARVKAARPIAGDPDVAWRAELAALKPQSSLDTLFTRFPENAVRLSEVEWSGQWAQAVLRDDEEAIAAAQRQLTSAGSALEQICGDRLISELATFVGRLPAQDRRDAAATIADFHRGRLALDTYAFTDAATTLAGAADRMRQQQNPLHLVAQFDHASALRAARQIAAAAKLLPSLQDAARPYPTVAARVHRLSGLVNVGTGRYARALEEYSTAKAAFAAVGFRKSATLTNTLIAEVLAQLGSRDIWRYHTEVLQLADSGASPRDLQSITFTAGLLALNEGLPEVANHFFAAMVTAAEQLGVPGAIAEARLNRARALLAMGDSAAFEAELQTATAIMDTLPVGSNVEFLRGEWAGVRADWLSRTNPAEAVDAAQAALEYARLKNRLPLIPRLHLAWGRALVGLKRDDEAERVFQEGIAAFERLWRSVTQDSLRISHFDLSWDLYGELVGVQMRLGHHLPALATLERSQARSLLAARDQLSVDWDLDLLQAAVHPSSALVYFMTGTDVTYGWVVRSTGTRAFVVPVRRDEIQRAALGSAASLERVGQRLLVPLAEGLAGATAIGFVAPGLLSQIPWANVEIAPGRSLIDTASAQLLPSGSFLALSKRAPRGSRVLVVASSTRVRDGVTDLPELPGARAEARAVASLYEHPTLRVDDEARAEVVLNDLKTHDIFHFAGHAVANESLPQMSRLILAAGDTISSSELSALATTRVRLAILTACSTATGAVVRSEGSVSISWMLLSRGIETVIATVRPISDRSASQFGVAFHTALRQGASATDSLRQAQLALRSSEPAGEHEWSYFVLVGGADQLLSGGL